MGMHFVVFTVVLKIPPAEIVALPTITKIPAPTMLLTEYAIKSGNVSEHEELVRDWER